MRKLVLSSSAILLATTAFAQMPPPPAPPPPANAPLAWQQSMTIGGTVVRFTLTPRGDLDGMILNDTTQVHVPPHLSDQLAAAVKAGDAVSVSGYRSPTGAVFIATSVTNTATNQTVVDRGPLAPGLAPPPPRPGMPAPGAQNSFAQGRVQRLLRGPAGDLNGAILDDGTILRMAPHIAYQFASVLIPGQTIATQGWGLSTPYGRVIDAQSIGTSTARLATDPGAVAPAPDERAPPRR
jgi:hypothetical protein